MPCKSVAIKFLKNWTQKTGVGPAFIRPTLYLDVYISGSPRGYGVNPENILESEIQHLGPHENWFHYPVTLNLSFLLLIPP